MRPALRSGATLTCLAQHHRKTHLAPLTTLFLSIQEAPGSSPADTLDCLYLSIQIGSVFIYVVNPILKHTNGHGLLDAACLTEPTSAMCFNMLSRRPSLQTRFGSLGSNPFCISAGFLHSRTALLFFLLVSIILSFRCLVNNPTHCRVIVVFIQLLRLAHKLTH